MKNHFALFAVLLASLVSFSASAKSVPLRTPAASGDTPSKLVGDALTKRVLTMRYCDFYSEGNYTMTVVFHRNNDVTIASTNEDGAYGDTANDSAYGSAYGKSAYHREVSNFVGKWSLTKDGKHIQIKNGEDSSVAYFGTKSYYQHRCYTEANAIK